MTPYKIAVYLFDGGDLMDFSGPVEIYSASPNPADPTFEVTSFAHHSPIRVQTNALVYTPNTTFKEISKNIGDYDILVIPGSHGEVIKSLIASMEGKELASLIKKFASLAPRQQGGRRILQSVCTGAILLASSGILAGRTVTSHHLDLDLLKQVADEAAGGDSKIDIVRKRWVHAGKTDAGVEIVNAGGITSGIDTSLWVYEQFAGKEMAEWVAEVEDGSKAVSSGQVGEDAVLEVLVLAAASCSVMANLSLLSTSTDRQKLPSLLMHDGSEVSEMAQSPTRNLPWLLDSLRSSAARAASPCRIEHRIYPRNTYLPLRHCRSASSSK